MDYARLRLLGLLQENLQVLTTRGNDFADVAKWLPDSHFLMAPEGAGPKGSRRAFVSTSRRARNSVCAAYSAPVS